MWSDRNARRVVLARLVSRSGGEAAFFVGIWGKAAFELGASPGGLAVLMAALGVAGLAGSAVAGVLIDRWGPKRVVVLGEILFMPATLAAVVAGDLTRLTAVAFLIGLIGTPVYTAIASFPPYLVGDGRSLAKVNGAVEAAGMAALVTGTAVGAIIARLSSLNAVFVFDAATSLVGAALVAGVSLRRRETVPGGGEGGWRQVREGFRFSYRHRRLRFYLLAATSLWLVFGLFGALEPLFYRDVLRTGPEAIGWVNTVFGIGLVAGTFLMGRLPSRLVGARALLLLLALNGLGCVLYVGTSHLEVVVAGAAFWGLVIGVFAPLARTMIHLNSPKDLIGRIMGTTQVNSEGAKLLPLLAAPGLAALLGVQAALGASGVLLAVLAALAWREGAALDRTRTEPVPPLEGMPRVSDEPISPNP